MTRSPRAVAVVLLVAALVSACTGQVTPPAGGTGDTGVVTLPTCGGTEDFTTPETRVAVTEQGVLDTFAALGVADRVVARSGGASMPDPANEPLFADVPDLGPSAPSTEGLLGATPDLVVGVRAWHFDSAQGGADAAAVRRAGAQIYPTRGGCAQDLQLAPDDTLDGVLVVDIENIGALLGVADRGVELTERLRAERDEIAARVADRPRVPGVQLGIVGGQLYATGAGMPAEQLATAGMENLFADPTQIYVPVSPEAVTAADPQAIVYYTFPTEDPAAQLDYLRTTFPATDAVRTGRIATIESRKTGTTSPAVFEGLAELAHFLHPDAVPPPGG